MAQPIGEMGQQAGSDRVNAMMYGINSFGEARRPSNGEEIIQPETSIEKVTIHKVSNGFIIRIGCKTFVSETWEKAAEGIGEYWDNPIKAQEKYCK